MANTRPNLILGVDTHKDFHYGAVINEHGKRISDAQFDATPEGNEELITWATGHGFVTEAGREGTGCYGLGLTERIQRRGIKVVDVIAPDRAIRRRQGKTD